MQDGEGSRWNSHRSHLYVLLCLVGYPACNGLPKTALMGGALGAGAVFLAATALVAVPLLYLELLVAQYTSRDCIDVWKVRPCLSHVGYIMFVWQIYVLVFNHIVTSFCIHYLWVSFERPVPFYTCGPWANKLCNVLETNFTVFEDCVKHDRHSSYCQSLPRTYRELQYWERFTLTGSLVLWRITLPSATICLVSYLACFRREKSLQFVASILVLYPLASYSVLFVGSMMQEGIVKNFSVAADLNLKRLSENVNVSFFLEQVIYMFFIGTGINFNLAARCGFRTPVLPRAASLALLTMLLVALATACLVMMMCPFMHTTSVHLGLAAADGAPVSNMFVLMPLLLYSYDYTHYWLVLIYTSFSVIGLRVSVTLFYSIINILETRIRVIAKYPGISSLLFSIMLFLITLPFLSSAGLELLFMTFQRYFRLSSLFFCVMEVGVFVVWYGVERFAEDVHFMQGAAASALVRCAWLACAAGLGYVLMEELRSLGALQSTEDLIGCLMLGATVGWLVLGVAGKLLWALWRGAWREAVALDAAWGPRDELLRRSRTMFTGQAMTKEFLYRQYRLQAGADERQRCANARLPRAPTVTLTDY